MTTQATFKEQQFVWVKSLKKKGKIIAVTRSIPQRFKVETIVSFDKEKQQRVTQVLTLGADEISPYREKKQTRKENKSLQIKIKYFDAEMPRVREIEIGDLIDLRSRERIEYKKGDFFIIPLGVAMEIPYGWKADVLPRSSTFKNWGIIQTNSVGKIDRSYSGDSDEWGMPVYATRDGVIEKYDRVCQFELTKKMPKVTFQECEFLGNTSRGGFGSTGTK